MRQPAPGRRWVIAEVDIPVADRFREVCEADHRTMSGGLRLLIAQHIESFDGPLNSAEPAANGLERSTTDTGSSRDRLAPA